MLCIPRHPQSSTGGGADVSYKVNDVGDDEDLEKLCNNIKFTKHS